MIQDHGDSLQITWNAAGKVKQVQKNNQVLMSLAYTPTGQRQTKTTNHLSLTTNHFYFHNATGNVMCIYEQQGDTLTATERPLYGSKRLGVLTQKVEIGHNGTLLSYNHNTIGTRAYELTDHLGNVTATILDRKELVCSDDTFYRPTVCSWTDYYPFGFPMSERSWRLDGYRYGFNGQEKDNEIYGKGESYTAEFWQYDSRLGRRWNIDPKGNAQVSPFACFAGNPVWLVDVIGDSVRPFGNAELTMIQNTLPKESRDYVQFDNSGFIDQKLLNSYNSESQNFNNLKTMVNSEITVEVKLDDQYSFKDQNGQLGTAIMSYYAFNPLLSIEKDLTGSTISGTSTGESGFIGKTLFPSNESIQNSPNNNIIVIVNRRLSPAAAAELYCHEANGHALLYILNGKDVEGACHQPINGIWVEGNITLKDMIIRSKQETIINMNDK